MDMIMVMAILVILMVMFNHGTFGSYEPTPPPLHADDRIARNVDTIADQPHGRGR